MQNNGFRTNLIAMKANHVSVNPGFFFFKERERVTGLLRG